MNCKNHDIEIESRKNNFSRELILISGCVKNQCEHEYIEITQHGHETLRTKIFNRNFKFLMRLDQQQNFIKLRYCEEEIELELNRNSIDPVFYDVQPLYIIPKNHDGRFQSLDDAGNSINDALMKVDLLTSLAQCVISSKVSNDEVTFELNKCEIFHSSMCVNEAWQLNQFELYDKIAEELLDHFGSDIVERRKFIGFMSCTKFLGLSDGEEHSYANIISKTQANPSLSSGFLALLGNGCFYAIPKKIDDVQKSFCDKTIVDTSKLLDDSNYRRTYGGCFSTTLGSLIHEIGHLFDLGHTENGLMGNDIDHVHRFFCCENFTEIMPKRNVSNCQQPTNRQEQKLFTNRLTKIKRNGENYLDKYREQKNNDLTFFEENCKITLMNHRWFTQRVSNNLLYFDDTEKTISSANESIMLIEIRDLRCNSMVKKFWNFTAENNIRKFKIDFDLNNCSLFAITNTGSILKKNFNID